MAVTILLICAVLASLSAGVLVAYGLCLAMFKAFRIHSIHVAATRAPAPIQAVLGS